MTPEDQDSTPRRRAPSAEVVRRGMRLSILEGIFAVQYITLTSATLLVGFLLALGASTAQIGIVAMLPLLGGLLQPLGAEFIRRRGGWRKPICVAGILLDDGLWILSLLAAALLPGPQAVAVVICVLALQQFATALTAISWTSWISDLIPPALRGRYFGKRNLICNGLGAITAILAGQFVEHIGHNAVWSFAVIIGVGIVSRFVSARILLRQPEPYPERTGDQRFREQFAAPLSHPGFRRYLHFGMAWGFSVQISAPFFSVYMIRDLQLDFGTVTILAGAATVANLLGQRFWGPLCDRFGNQQVMRLTALVIVLQPFWWIFTAPSGFGFYLIVVLNVIGGFAWAGYLLANGNLMMVLAPEIGKTSFFAVQAALSGLFGALGPLAGGLMADYLLGTWSFPAWLPSALPVLFLVSFVLRAGAWGLLHRVHEPVHKPRLRVTYLIGDAVRTFNITQGFSPLLHPFAVSLDDFDLEEALDELIWREE